MDVLLLIAAIVLILLGVAGSFVPVLPGPPISYIALLMLHYTKYAMFTTQLLVVFAILTILVTLLDYVIPAWATGKFGGSRQGRLGAFAGTMIGLIFGPLGVIIGPFIGAFTGEILANKNANEALRSGVGSFVGFLAGTGLKLILSLVMMSYFLYGLFS